jgi:tmRNA-binding protein
MKVYYNIVKVKIAIQKGNQAEDSRLLITLESINTSSAKTHKVCPSKV